MALANVPAYKNEYFGILSGDSLLTKSGNDIVQVQGPEGPGRSWKVEVALPLVQNLAGRDFERGKRMFIAASCGRCHTLPGDGGSTGTDLTSLGTSFATKVILRSEERRVGKEGVSEGR